MSDKWERSLIVPAGKQDGKELEETRRLIGYGVRAVFSRNLRGRDYSLPVTFLQRYRGFPRKCPEQYCSASIRLENDGCCFAYHGRGQALTCHEGHRFVCFRFRRFVVLSKLDLYLARLDAAKWQQVIHFPARSAYGRGLLRALWDAPYEEVLCGSARPVEARIVARWRGFRRRFASQLSPSDRALIRARIGGCLDLCSEGLQLVRDHVSAMEFACARGHRTLVSKSQRGTFISSRMILSVSLAAESL
jgi:hypothetical protein